MQPSYVLAWLREDWPEASWAGSSFHWGSRVLSCALRAETRALGGRAEALVRTRSGRRVLPQSGGTRQVVQQEKGTP